MGGSKVKKRQGDGQTRQSLEENHGRWWSVGKRLEKGVEAMLRCASRVKWKKKISPARVITADGE